MNNFLVEKEQLRRLFQEWHCNEKPPTSKTKVVIAFPAPAKLNLATVTVAKSKSTDRKRLYQIQFQHI